MTETLKAHYVIIGAGPAGIAATEAIREVDREKSVLIITDDHPYPYCRPLIIEVLKGEKKIDDILLRPKDWFDKNNILKISGDRVTRIIPEKKQIEFGSGLIVEWEKLLIATGSKPSQPPIDGLSDNMVYTMYDYNDAESARDLIKPGSRLLVLGIGLIGLQAMMALAELGIDICAVELMPKVLPLILDLKAARYVQYKLEDHGLDVRVGTSIKKIVDSDSPKFRYEAVTNSGETIGFDSMLLATGMRPEIALLNGSGVEIDRGIKVTPRMETNIPDIYAAGDVTEYNDWIEGRSEIHAHWINASRQGRIAGFSMVGKNTTPYEPIYLNSMSVFGLPIITMGASRIDHFENAKVYVSDSPLRPAYSRLAIRNGLPVAATFINDVERAGVFQYLIREKVNIGDVAESLFNSGLDGLEFIYELHDKVIKGDVDWPESMYAVEFYKKDQEHTRWGKKEGGK